MANTRASGQRWLIIGVTNKTSSYFGPPDATVTSERIEQILARYTVPCVDIHCKVVDAQFGRVGLLEVIRDPKKLPYRVAKSITGNKKKIVQDQIFVRHGPHVEEPSSTELQYLLEEGESARATTP